MRNIIFERIKKQDKKISKNTATAVKSAVAGFVLMTALIFATTGCDFAGSATQKSATAVQETAAVIEAWEPMEVSEKEQTDRIIAHGGGSVGGYQTSNSAEAIMHAADIGFKLIELDFNMTSDNHVVLVHDWEETTTYYYRQRFSGPIPLAKFQACLSYGKFHTVAIENLIAIMDKSQSFSVVTDAKDANMEVLEAIANEYPQYLGRFIPQIYSYEQYEKVHEWGYDNIILTLYEMPYPVNASQVLNFYREKGLYAITVVDEAYMEPIVNELLANNVKIYRHPINKYERYQELLSQGCYGVYTSGIQPSEITSETAEYYITMPDENNPNHMVKLTDYEVKGKTVKEVVALEVAGLKQNEYRIYYIGDDGVRMTDQGLDELPYGKVHMPVEIWEVNQRFVGHYTGKTLDYYIWKNENGVRILDSKYEYRADLRKVIPRMEDLSDAKEVDPRGFKKLTSILKRSLVANAGDYYYYYNAKAGNFMLEDEFFYAAFGDGISEAGGKDVTEVYIPVAESARALGAGCVNMSIDENIVITLPEAVTPYGKDIFVANRNGYPYMPFLQKTLVSGRYLGEIFGRDVLEGVDDTAGILVILPENVKKSDLTDKEIKRLLRIAKRLYE